MCKWQSPCLVLVFFCLALTVSISQGAETLPERIDGKPTPQFIQGFTTEYIGQMDGLLEGFAPFKDARDYAGFNAFKRGWLANYSPRRKHYEAVLERNRPALMDSGLVKLVSGFIELELSANHLANYLRSGDHAQLDIVKAHTHELINYLGQLNKDHHLNLKIN